MEHEEFKRTYGKTFANWIMNEGRALSKKYKCWPLPEAFGFAVRLNIDGILDRKKTKLLLEDMFQCAAANPAIAVHLDRTRKNAPDGK